MYEYAEMRKEYQVVNGRHRKVDQLEGMIYLLPLISLKCGISHVLIAGMDGVNCRRMSASDRVVSFSVFCRITAPTNPIRPQRLQYIYACKGAPAADLTLQSLTESAVPANKSSRKNG